MKKTKISAALMAIIMTFAMSASVFGETLPEAEATTPETGATTVVQAAEAADPDAQTTDPTQTAESTDPTQPVDPTQPTQPAEPTQPAQPATQPTKPAAKAITKGAALNIALKNAGLSKSKVRIIEVDVEKGSVEIEFVRLSNKAKYEYEIATKDGRILEKSVDFKYKKSKSKKKIGKKKARKIVAKAVGKSYNVVKKGSCKYQYKKKCGKYEVKFRSGNYKYEYELLAKNGKIVEYEYEYIGVR